MVVTASLPPSPVFVDRTPRRAAYRDVAEGVWPPTFAASLGPWHIRAHSNQLETIRVDPNRLPAHVDGFPSFRSIQQVPAA